MPPNNKHVQCISYQLSVLGYINLVYYLFLIMVRVKNHPYLGKQPGNYQVILIYSVYKSIFSEYMYNGNILIYIYI